MIGQKTYTCNAWLTFEKVNPWTQLEVLIFWLQCIINANMSHLNEIKSKKLLCFRIYCFIWDLDEIACHFGL